MLGLHIATMRYECQKSPFVMEDHEFDLNLMVRTRGFTHCHDVLGPAQTRVKKQETRNKTV